MFIWKKIKSRPDADPPWRLCLLWRPTDWSWLLPSFWGGCQGKTIKFEGMVLLPIWISIWWCRVLVIHKYIHLQVLTRVLANIFTQIYICRCWPGFLAITQRDASCWSTLGSLPWPSRGGVVRLFFKWRYVGTERLQNEPCNFKWQNHQAAHPKMIAPVADCPDLMVSDMTQEIGFVESIKEGASPNYEQHPLGSLLQLVKIIIGPNL